MLGRPCAQVLVRLRAVMPRLRRISVSSRSSDEHVPQRARVAQGVQRHDVAALVDLGAAVRVARRPGGETLGDSTGGALPVLMHAFRGTAFAGCPVIWTPVRGDSGRRKGVGNVFLFLERVGTGTSLPGLGNQSRNLAESFRKVPGKPAPGPAAKCWPK